jgi:hypothetical protein
MSDAKKTPGSDTLGIIFKNPKPKQDESAESPMTRLYGRSLASISNPEKKDIRAFNIESAFSGKTLEEGTIVSDRKKDRPTFLQNVGAAFKEWRKTTARALGVPDAPKTDAVPVKKPIPPTIPEKHTETREKPIEKMRVMQHKEATIVAPVATAPVSSATTLFKVRTLKSDSAILQKTTLSIPPSTTPKVEPLQEVVAELSEQVIGPKKEEPVPEKIPPVAPKPNILEKEKRVLTHEQHTERIAPDVAMRLSTDVKSFAPRTPGVVQKNADAEPKKKESAVYGIHIPETITYTETPVPPASQKTVAPVPQRSTESPRWTHTIDAAPATVPVAGAIKEEAARTDVQTPSFLRESTAPIMPDEVRSIQVDPSPEQLSVPEIQSKTAPASVTSPNAKEKLAAAIASVKPELNVPEERPLVSSPISPTPMEYGQESTFHAGAVPRITAVEATTHESPATQTRTVTPVVRRTSPQTTNFTGFALRILGTLIGVGACIVLIAVFVTRNETNLSNDVDAPGTVPETTERGTGASPETSSLLLAGDPDMLLTALSRMLRENAGDSTYARITIDEPPRDATAAEFFTYLETNLSPRAVRSLAPELTVGSVMTTHPEPFLVIRSESFDTLFAGLLAWEDAMQEDLAPLFGEARDTHIPFTDAVQNNASIRILREDGGAEILLYSFIDERTVVITTSGDALAQIIPRIR